MTAVTSTEGIRDDDLAHAVRIDLADPQLYLTERPERIWRTLRSAGRPFRVNGDHPYWVVTRYRQVREVLRDTRSFSSERGMQLGVDRGSAALAAEAAAGKMLIVADGPAHAEIRKAIGAAFSPKMVRRLRQRTLEIANGLVSAMVNDGNDDFVTAVAMQLPAIVICDLLGVPEQDRAYVTGLTRTAFGDPGKDPASSQVVAHAELFDYCDELLSHKRREPADDVGTVLASATLHGEPMNREVAVLNCHGLISGGIETTRHASSFAAMTMVSSPDEWARLRAGDVDIDDAVEELLRMASPAVHVMRYASSDVEVGEAAIGAGEYVTVWLGSANRDEDEFENPDRLQFDRKPNRHLTFGVGSHFCLGAFLARLELHAVVRALLDVVSAADLKAQPQRLASNILRGYATLPLALRRR